MRKLLESLFCAVLLVVSAAAHAQDVPHPGRLAPGTMVPSTVEGGAVEWVGPGDTLYLTVFGQPDLAGQVTVGVEGEVTVPVLGPMRVVGLTPAAIAARIAQGLRERGYLVDPQVSVEVVKVRSRMVSILGEVNHPGRYPIESRLTLLELLAIAGGRREDADDTVMIMRRGQTPGDEPQRLSVFLGSRVQASRAIEDADLQAGDVVYVGRAQRFFVYGEVRNGGAYPVEPELNVMRALALAGGLTDRASERRIDLSRPDPVTGEMQKRRAALTDLVRPGDVIHVNERFF